jgi:hypothetical protein
MIVLGLLLLLAACVVGLVGVLTNLSGQDFSIFGMPVGGASGWLFLFGIVVGAVGMLGLAMIRGANVRSRRLRKELKQTRRETESLRKERERGHERVTRGEETARGREAPTTSETTHAGETRAGEARPTDTPTGEARSADIPQQRAAEHKPSFRERLGFRSRK